MVLANPWQQLLEMGVYAAWFADAPASVTDTAGMNTVDVGSYSDRLFDFTGNGRHQTFPTSAARPSIVGGRAVYAGGQYNNVIELQNIVATLAIEIETGEITPASAGKSVGTLGVDTLGDSSYLATGAVLSALADETLTLGTIAPTMYTTQVIPAGLNTITVTPGLAASDGKRGISINAVIQPGNGNSNAKHTQFIIGKRQGVSQYWTGNWRRALLMHRQSPADAVKAGILLGQINNISTLWTP